MTPAGGGVAELSALADWQTRTPEATLSCITSFTAGASIAVLRRDGTEALDATLAGAQERLRTARHESSVADIEGECRETAVGLHHAGSAEGPSLRTLRRSPKWGADRT